MMTDSWALYSNRQAIVMNNIQKYRDLTRCLLQHNLNIIEKDLGRQHALWQ